ncbi:hypothetical protein BU14_2739s0001 [Porphyra umbilicalis]|uniref:Uncharacterized protein n=1 Tax=Porphyra umbilicalis TaxID=2786 RepID=A0A1X6NIL7_PORUM|nr:hypothetical protein BU14_2739s0001 [Porphyra umbilicalis]|eukprot:OSX68471.1 hypothetical protein BU14_2739s0001 [Porphyra umbilicalis]
MAPLGCLDMIALAAWAPPCDRPGSMGAPMTAEDVVAGHPGAGLSPLSPHEDGARAHAPLTWFRSLPPPAPVARRGPVAAAGASPH